MTSFSKLDRQTQEDLVNWLNISKPDGADKRRLAALHAKGLFRAWNCPNCGARVYLGEPDDWGNFQGVTQADYCSYPPVTRIAETWCDHCRCWHQSKLADAESILEDF